MPVVNTLARLREFFDSGITKSYAFRIKQLELLKSALMTFEKDFYKALNEDLKKTPEESWVTENGMLMAELNKTIRHLQNWMKPERVGTNLVNLPSKSYVLNEPLGVVLIIGPWNYPLMLLFTPLVGAMAAGNCVVLKSSEFAPATSAVMKQLIQETFDEQYILFTEGDGASVVPGMMNNFIFDHVFYTGSTAVGKIVYQMAAQNLVPVTLELGGKSPCIVEADAHIKVAAKRIALAKFSNAGQMCVAPDYILIHDSVKEVFIAELKKHLKDFFGDDPKACDHYGKIINEKQFDRLLSYLQDGNIIHGGKSDRQALYIEPTLITGIVPESRIMTEEIFGPILPIISWQNRDDALKIIALNKNPLACYIFTSSSENEQKWIKTVAFGGGCVNNVSWHLTNHNLPFGGRGFSGTGHYHGKYSFDTFSHKKAIMKTPTWFDPYIKYPPFKGRLNLFKWLVK